MRVLHLLSSTGMHGAETMVLQLTIALRRLGVDAVVGLFDRGDTSCDSVAGCFEEAAITVERFRDSARVDFQLARAIRAFSRRAGIGILHSHKTKCTLHALLGRAVPLVVTYHNWIVTTRALRGYAFLDRVMSRYVDARVAVSGEVAATLRSASRGAVYRIDNGVDLVRWRPVPAASAARHQLGLGNALVIGFVGRLGPEKGLDLLLDAVARVPQVAGREVRLLIAGDGEARAGLEAQARVLGLSRRVSFLGECADPLPIYTASDVIALTSHTEGFPMVVVEAMASGRPVIAAAVGELPSMIEHGLTGWLLTGRDPGALANLLQTECGDIEHLRTMGMAARIVAERRFSSATMAARYLEVYRVAAAG
jgi:glycosyltransferase involved in cell wall biosynthesis